jgi:hypothetical protein
MKKLIVLLVMVVAFWVIESEAKDFDFSVNVGIGLGQVSEKGSQTILPRPPAPHSEHSYKRNYYPIFLKSEDTSPVYNISGQVIYNGKGLPQIFSILKLTGEINYRWASYDLHIPTSGDEMNPWYLSAMLGITKNLGVCKDGIGLRGLIDAEK